MAYELDYCEKYNEFNIFFEVFIPILASFILNSIGTYCYYNQKSEKYYIFFIRFITTTLQMMDFITDIQIQICQKWLIAILILTCLCVQGLQQKKYLKCVFEEMECDICAQKCCLTRIITIINRIYCLFFLGMLQQLIGDVHLNYYANHIYLKKERKMQIYQKTEQQVANTNESEQKLQIDNLRKIEQLEIKNQEIQKDQVILKLNTIFCEDVPFLIIQIYMLVKFSEIQTPQTIFGTIVSSMNLIWNILRLTTKLEERLSTEQVLEVAQIVVDKT